jgi:hypothetical protein
MKTLILALALAAAGIAAAVEPAAAETYACLVGDCSA